MKKDEFENLLDKHLRGEATSEEIRLIESFHDAFSSKYTDKVFASPLEKERTRLELLHKIKPRTKKGIPIWRIAASLVLLMGLGFFIWNAVQQASLQKMSTAHGELQQITLSDGSIVRLAAESSLEFPKYFDKDQRAVTLKGQAYFQVAHDSIQPFTIQANGVEVKVLGTEFNVSAYTEDSLIAVSLVQGSVQVRTANQENILIPGQQARVGLSDTKIEIIPFDSNYVLAWTRKQLAFQRNSLRQVANTLKRQFGVQVQFDKPQYADYTISARFKDANVIEVLGAISKAKKLNFKKVKKDTYLIYENGK